MLNLWSDSIWLTDWLWESYMSVARDAKTLNIHHQSAKTMDDLWNIHNIWLKDLQQRRQTRHLSLVNPIHFILYTSSQMSHVISSETTGLRSSHVRTIKFPFFFPPSLPYNRVGENGNRSIPTMPPNRWTPAAGWIKSCTEVMRDIRISTIDNFPRLRKGRRLAATLLSAVRIDHIWVQWIQRFLGSNNEWQEGDKIGTGGEDLSIFKPAWAIWQMQ
jgi:hypothetical protein